MAGLPRHSVGERGYDPADGLFKMWYTGGYLASMCYATSKDGVHWEKPDLDVREGTNVVLDPVHGHHRFFDTNTVWLDHDARDQGERFKYFATEVAGESTTFKGKTDWRLVYRTQPRWHSLVRNPLPNRKSRAIAQRPSTTRFGRYGS